MTSMLRASCEALGEELKFDWSYSSSIALLWLYLQLVYTGGDSAEFSSRVSRISDRANSFNQYSCLHRSRATSTPLDFGTAAHTKK